jgi:hypothetical protein
MRVGVVSYPGMPSLVNCRRDFPFWRDKMENCDSRGTMESTVAEPGPAGAARGFTFRESGVRVGASPAKNTQTWGFLTSARWNLAWLGWRLTVAWVS